MGGCGTYLRAPCGRRSGNRAGRVLVMVLGRGGVDPALGGGGGERERLLEEACVAIATLASRLRAEQERRARAEARWQLDREILEGQLGLMEERLDEMCVALQSVIRGTE